MDYAGCIRLPAFRLGASPWHFQDPSRSIKIPTAKHRRQEEDEAGTGAALSRRLPAVIRSPASQASQASLGQTSRSASPPEVKPSPATAQASTSFKLHKRRFKKPTANGKKWKKTQLTKAPATTGWRVSKLLQVVVDLCWCPNPPPHLNSCDDQ